MQRGYLERQADPNDGRARIVRVTQAGARLSATGRSIIRDVEREWGDRIGAERMALLRLTRAGSKGGHGCKTSRGLALQPRWCDAWVTSGAESTEPMKRHT